MIERWTRVMIRHRWIVLGAWLLVFAASGAAASGLSDLLTNRFTLPGTDTKRAEDILEEHFGQKSTGAFTLVVTSESRPAESVVPAARAAATRAVEELPTARLAGVDAIAPNVVSASIVSELEPADAKGHTDDMREAAGGIPGAAVYLTGQSAIEHDLDPVFAEDLKVGELYIAIPAAMLLLIFVFGSLAFLIPFMFAAATIPACLGIIWVVANFTELTTYLQNMVMLIGLGVAIDYSLLMVYRYREELRANGTREEALVRTMQTAGNAVIFSGTAVAVGLALLLFMPLPFMRGFGVSLSIPIMSVVCALTLLPVLMYFLGGKLDRIGLKRIVERRADDAHNFWPRLARTIMRRPVLVATGTAALLLALAAPVLDLELGPGSNEGIPTRLESMQGLNILSEAVGEGATSPTQVVIDTGRPGGAEDPQVAQALDGFETLLLQDPEVARVTFPEGPQFIDSTGRYVRIEVVGTHEYGLPESMDFVERLRVVVFKWGVGESLGLTGFDQIEGWIPVFLFAMLFGLSMDYEVFLVSRMREEWDRTHDNEYAVASGLAKTGRLVTVAGLVMFAAFMGFVAGSIVGLQQFGFGLAAAVLIDVTIVRALLVPSAMKIFGRWNWWLPEGVAKVFRVKPSPLVEPPRPALRPTGR